MELRWVVLSRIRMRGILLAFSITLLGSGLHAIAESESVVVHPSDTGEALVNPSMGWMLYFYSNLPTNYGSKLKPSDTVDEFPGLSTIYFRLPWALLEPEEGVFNWSVFDTPAQRWVDSGKRIILRVTCSENWMTYATPEWVKRAGAKGFFYEFGKGRVEKSDTWDPFFGDPVFLEKLDHFLEIMALRYDGSPNVEFIDIGSFGLWGEGHTFISSKQQDENVIQKHIDLYLKHFKKTQLCISDDVAGYNKMGRDFPIMDYALSHGVTMRDDSIMVHPAPNAWCHDEMAQEFWPKLPVVLECEHYGPAKFKKAWDTELLMKAVEDYHASYLSVHWWPHEFLAENRDIIRRVNQRLGYRLFPQKISWPREIHIGERFSVEWSWCNKGVAPCYPGGYPALTFKDANAGIVAVLCDEAFNMCSLSTGDSGSAPKKELISSFVLGIAGDHHMSGYYNECLCNLQVGDTYHVDPVIRSGEYDVFISVGTRDGTPQIALPLGSDDGSRRYFLGTITIR